MAAPHISVDQKAENSGQNWKQLSPSKLPEPASVNEATAQRFSKLPKQDFQLGTKCSDTGLWGTFLLQTIGHALVAILLSWYQQALVLAHCDNGWADLTFPTSKASVACSVVQDHIMSPRKALHHTLFLLPSFTGSVHPGIHLPAEKRQAAAKGPSLRSPRHYVR